MVLSRSTENFRALQLTFLNLFNSFFCLSWSSSFVFFASVPWVLQGNASLSLRCLFPGKRHEGSDHFATRTNWMGQLLGPHYFWCSSSLSTPPPTLLFPPPPRVISLPCWCATKHNEFFMYPLHLRSTAPLNLSFSCFGRGRKEGNLKKKRGRWLMPCVIAKQNGKYNLVFSLCGDNGRKHAQAMQAQTNCRGLLSVRSALEWRGVQVREGGRKMSRGTTLSRGIELSGGEITQRRCLQSLRLDRSYLHAVSGDTVMLCRVT